MKLDSNHPDDTIFTSDLTYTSPNDRYTYRFSYLGDGVFWLISKGSIDDNAFKRQLASGDKARERLRVIFPKKEYHLIWDVTEVKWGSIIARYMGVSKLKTASQFGSLTFVGANNFIRNFGLIAGKLAPNVELFFFKTFHEAIQNLEDNFKKHIHFDQVRNNQISANSDSYSRFIDLWQNNPNFIRFAGEQYKITTNAAWQHISADHTFYLKVSLIEGNIVYFECEGFLRPLSIDVCYGILEVIMDDLGFNSSDNKFYTILNIKKIKSISLGARKRISHYEQLYKDRSNMVVLVAKPSLLFLLRFVRKLSLDNFSHWDSADSPETGFMKILTHHKGQSSATTKIYAPSFQEETLKIPNDPAEMIKLIQNQHKELTEIKRNHHEQIHRIIEIIGRMTWDETFEIPNLISENDNPFHEIYNSLSILFQDFKEIIQEKQLHTQKLIESEDKYRNLINLANDIIIVYQDDNIRFLNSRVEQTLGYKPEEIVGQSMDNLVAPEEIARLRDYHIRRIKGDEIPWIYETVFLHRDGHRVPVSMSVGLILYENKLAAMVIARDNTQKKKTEEELERYRNHLEDIIKQRTLQLQREISERKVAEESDRLKTAFLSNMSHEIRTPMNAIISFSNFLKEPDIPSDQREEYLNYILSSGQSLLNLINDIIDISKIEAKQLNIHETHCHVNAIMDELFRLFEETRKSIEKNDLAILVSIPDRTKNIALFTDPYRLKQILSNLLDNALKFTDSGSITIGYELNEDSITFFVKDTGIGIPNDKKEYIFKRFGKIKNFDKNLSGTGLGLAISKHLSLLLNGSLWVESEESKGSCFYLKLPYTKTNEFKIEQANASKYDGNYDWKNKKILVVEDEDLNYKVLQIALRKTNVEIIRAINGKEAVDITNNVSNINLILMDIQMPVMDGYEAMTHIKKLKPGLPIIAQTAFALLEEQKHCLDLGFNDYISKPIDTSELFRKIEAQLTNN